jgi:hypothetical protein
VVVASVITAVINIPAEKEEVMRILAIALIFCFGFALPALAKQDSSGYGKSKKDQVHKEQKIKQQDDDDEKLLEQREEQERVEERNREEIQVKSKDKQAQESNKGLEKQREKKSEQVQKELGKGSEQGQQAREKRKKWWKFWGDGE